MNDNFKDYWIEMSKEEIIKAYIVLLSRINKAIEYIEKVSDNGEFEIDEDEVIVLLDILKGSDKE